MATNHSPSEYHTSGLDASVERRDFVAARLFLDRAILGYVAEGSDVEAGAAHRDMVLVGAGLGDLSLRDYSLDVANEIHESACALAPLGENSYPASELAATLHVSARVQLARHLDGEEGDDILWEMVNDWDRAYGLLTDFGGVNRDYLEQVVSHGSLAIAGFGRDEDLPTGIKFTKDPVVKGMKKPERIKAISRASKLLVARDIGLPVHRIPVIRNRIAGAVAGQYRIAA